MTEPSQEDETPRVLHPRLFLGTSSWSSDDWLGRFYPDGTPAGDYLGHYATRYRSVEVDATFYSTPATTMTRKWRRILPDGFVMAAKVPQVITHEKRLDDCQEEMNGFLRAMDELEDRLGALLFQFPYFSKASGVTFEHFVERLRAFLPTLPEGYRFAVEIRNKSWLKPALLDLLRKHGVALALIDHPWMPRVEEILGGMDPVTAEFCYIRWLGDRHGIEKRTKSWDRIIVDRAREMGRWVPAIRTLLERKLTVYGYFNNHYAGYAPGSIQLFEDTWSGLTPGTQS
jgi:uncharacterized protein YecE (DUF72 family)